MAEFNTISIPASWDHQFLSRTLRTSGPIGLYPADDGSWILRYDGRDVDAVAAAIADYPTAYLEVALPAALAEASAERDRRIQKFSFNGQEIPLDDQTKLNLDCAALGLMRNADVPSIAWSLGNGQFVELPRDVVLGMADLAFRHTQQLYAKHHAIAEAMHTAHNINELNAIDVKDDATWS